MIGDPLVEYSYHRSCLGTFKSILDQQFGSECPVCQDVSNIFNQLIVKYVNVFMTLKFIKVHWYDMLYNDKGILLFFLKQSLMNVYRSSFTNLIPLIGT